MEMEHGERIKWCEEISAIHSKPDKTNIFDVF
jgi:hypothetical protein